MKPKIFIDGEHGTTGLQIRTRMAGRADVELLSIPEAERRNAAIREDLLNSADIAILCLPDDASKESVAMTASQQQCASSTRRRPFASPRTGPMASPKWTRRRARRSVAPLRRQSRLLSAGAIGLIRPLARPGILPDIYMITVNAVSGYTGGGKQMIAQIEDATNPE